MKNKSHSITYIFDSERTSFEKIDIIIPELKEGEILVKNEYVTLCRNDINIYIGKRKEKNPTILGHEIVGRIVSFHKDANRNDLLNNELKVEDRITWGIYSSDPNSYYSQCGIPQKGDKLFKYGHEEVKATDTLHGGLAEYIVLRKHTPIIKLDEKIPLKIAATINCSVATVSGAFRLAGNISEKKILVVGVGMFGIVACAFAKSLKAKLVASVDNNLVRLNESKLFGADITYNSTVNNTEDVAKSFEKYDVVFDFSGVPNMMELSLKLLDLGGTAVWVGAMFPQKEVKISAEKLIRNIHTIKGLHNYNQEDLVTAIEFINENYQKYPFENLVEDIFTLEETKDAFKYAISHNPYRVGIEIK